MKRISDVSDTCDRKLSVELLVFSHKICWRDRQSPSGFSTHGGFPRQIEAISSLFSATTLVNFERRSSPPGGLTPLNGHELNVNPVREPGVHGMARKVWVLGWLLSNLRPLLRKVKNADAVHAIVPGDMGLLGIWLALLAGKPLFVRHCGTWGNRRTISDRLLMFVLKRTAKKKVVVFATGGGPNPPELSIPAIEWIFSTTLRKRELAGLRRDSFWKGGPIKIATVGRLSKGKNTISSIRAMPEILNHYPNSTLEVVGDGPARTSLEAEVSRLEVEQAVVFHGNVNHEGVVQILKQCDLFVFPTRVAEGFPKAVLEAMACGLPVVASRVSVLPSLVEPDCGAILREATPSCLAAAVLKLTSSSVSFQNMAVAAQEEAKIFTLEQWSAAIRERLEAAWGLTLCSHREAGPGSE